LVPSRPKSGVERVAPDRDRTMSLNISPDDSLDAGDVSILAQGTHGERGEEGTKVDSPQAQKKPAPKKRPPPVPNDPDAPELRLGTTLGNYRVEEILGKGGMGYVYRAEHVKLGREVAIKLLRADYARRRDAVARFIQEARTVNRIRHRNIVDVPDIIELDDGTTFIVMEFLRGQSLGKWARSGIDLPRALAVLVQICDGLAAAHAVGVVHRDLKPDNVIVVPTSDGAELVKLLDFGVAKLLNRDDEDIGFQTAAGSVIGTPAYMSPEQAGGMVIDARSDTYSLGAIMYELFTGQAMFRGRSFGEYVRKHLTERPTPPRQTQGGYATDERLEAIIMKCLEKDPNARWNTIVELRDALLTMLGGLETHPPGFAAVSQLRSYPLNPGAATIVPLVPIPMGPPVMQHPTPNPLAAHAASMINPSSSYMTYGQHSSHLSQIIPPTGIAQAPGTPWFVWFIGGAIAVGLGVAGALWYANRDTPAIAAVVEPQKPIAEPIDEPKVVPPPRVKVKFDSLPSGAVFEAGRSAELCKTPCVADIDPADGGSIRKFIVRAANFKDAEITVDLVRTTNPDFRVTLEAIPTVAQPDPTETTSVEPDPSATTKQGTRRTGGTTTRRTGGTTRVDPKPDLIEKKPDPVPEVKPDPVPEKKPDKGDTKIDPSETLDPFKRKRGGG